MLDGPAAARLFTIKISGGAAEVTPALPMFIRTSAWWRTEPPANSDERFIIGENHSAVWAAAALSSATVINRPGPSGWFEHLTPAAMRPFVDEAFAPSLAEVYASGPEHAMHGVAERTVAEHGVAEVAGDSDGTPTATAIKPARVLWGKNVERAAGPVAELSPRVPLRARMIDPQALYEVVTVVGERAFTATSDKRAFDLGLAERSVLLAQRAGVHFATITWSVQDDTAEPARVNASPRDGDLRFAWTEAEQALCEDLLA